MDIFTMRILVQNLYLANRDDWERTRLSAYVSARTMGSKISSPQKFLPFGWDGKEIGEDTNKPTQADRERLLKLAEKYGTRIKNSNTT
jgi:hypothetical protein|nr:MAG TPA: Splicing factor 3B subunit 4 complex, splicing, RNA, protein [Caudoviricetes sp.]